MWNGLYWYFTTIPVHLVLDAEVLEAVVQVVLPQGLGETVRARKDQEITSRLNQCVEFFKRAQFHQKKTGIKRALFQPKNKHLTGEITKFQPKKRAVSTKIQNFFLEIFLILCYPFKLTFI